MNAPIAFKRSYLASQRSTAKKFVKAFADATRYIVVNKPGTLRPLTQLLNTSDSDVTDFAYDLPTPIQRQRSIRPPRRWRI